MPTRRFEFKGTAPRSGGPPTRDEVKVSLDDVPRASGLSEPVGRAREFEPDSGEVPEQVESVSGETQPEPPSPPEAPAPPSGPRGHPPDIIPGILPSSQVHLLSGASGAGKTGLAAWLLARIIAGDEALGFTCRPPAFVGVIATDRTWEDHSKWYALVGLEAIPHLSIVDTPEVNGKRIRGSKTDLTAVLISLISTLLDGRDPYDSLIFVDTLPLFLGGNLGDYIRVYTHMLDLNQYCAANGVTLLGAAHSAKMKADPKSHYADTQERILGSGAQLGCAGTAFHLAPPQESGQSYTELSWKAHHTKPGVMSFERDEETGLLLPTSATYDPKQNNEERILPIVPYVGEAKGLCYKDALHAGKMRWGISPATVKRVLSELAKTGLIVNIDRQWYRRKDS